MNEKPKTVWNRPWKGWKNLAAWFVILLTASFLGIATIGSLTGLMSPDRIIVRTLPPALAITLLGIFAVRFAHWLNCWQNVRRLLFGLACLATLVALFYAEENIRGRLAWNRYVQEQTAKGEVLDFVQLAPAPIPDDDNFFMTPLWDGVRFVRTNDHTVWKQGEHSGPGFSMTRANQPNSHRRWSIGQRSDLVEWQRFFRAEDSVAFLSAGQTNHFPTSETSNTPARDVLLALGVYEPDRTLLTLAAARPKARFWINYEDGYGALLPHLAGMKSISIYLSLHGAASLEAGDTEAAYQDVMLSFRLAESVRDEPVLISHLVRMALLQIMMQPVWEGLATGAWSETQLTTIDAALGRLDFIDDYELSMRAERALGIWAVDHAERNRQEGFSEWFGYEADGWLSFPNPLTAQLFKAIPKGWFDQNKIVLCQTIEEHVLSPFDSGQLTLDPSAATDSKAAVERLASHRSAYNYAARVLLPALRNATKEFAYAQATADLARVAIALERYRLAIGEFPEALDSLVPKWIDSAPHDVINGEALNYRRTSDGRFLLYSVGWNKTNDGGEVALGRGGNRIDIRQGDWVWRYPEE